MNELVVVKHDPAKVKHKRPIRKGDRVRILEPKFIDRVGYPLIWGMLMDEVENDPKVIEALSVLGLRGGQPVPHYLKIAIAKLRVEQRGFGGRERTIHYEKDTYRVPCKGAVTEVYGRRVVKTGTYYPPSAGGSNCDYDWEPEPGGLADCKSHVLLMTSHGEIEACNVELLDE
jgi:hypothetical protein